MTGKTKERKLKETVLATDSVRVMFFGAGYDWSMKVLGDSFRPRRSLKPGR